MVRCATRWGSIGWLFAKDERKVGRVDHARSRAGSRRIRLESRRQRRDGRFGRFLGLTALGTLIPGAGLLAAGRRGWGTFFLTLVILGILAGGLVLWRVPRSQLAASAFDQSQLGVIAIGLTAVAAVWLLVAVASLKALEPGSLSGGQRFTGSLVVIMLASVIVAPMAVGARYAWTQSDLIEGITQDSAFAPEQNKDDPWANLPRVNVLLMGSDAGVGREGTRPDTLILASIDTDSGDTVMFSLPRNLEKVPFPSDSALHERFPDGFQGVPGEDPALYMINAVYRNAPPLVAEDVFAGSDDPGADATKLAVAGALGIDVHYYVMADLQGFQDIVDAMGGVTIDVNYPIPIGSKKIENGFGCTPPRDWILPSDDQHLDGAEALWFARARCGPDHPDYADLYLEIGGNPVVDDYNRMERQRCMMGAIADKANPGTLLPRFQDLATATETNIKTDIPADLFGAFAELGMEVKDASITSLPFTHEVIPDTASPDYVQIHAVVQEALDPERNQDPAGEAATDEPPAGQADNEPENEGDGTTPTDDSGTPATEEAADQAVDLAAAC